MKTIGKLVYLCCLLVMMIGIGKKACAKDKADPKVEFISGYKIDLNDDNILDDVTLVKKDGLMYMHALVRTEKDYCLLQVSTASRDMKLTCEPGLFVKETVAGNGDKEEKLHKTPGAYICLKQPEGAAVAYYWNGDGFTEVWIED